MENKSYTEDIIQQLVGSTGYTTDMNFYIITEYLASKSTVEIEYEYFNQMEYQDNTRETCTSICTVHKVAKEGSIEVDYYKLWYQVRDPQTREDVNYSYYFSRHDYFDPITPSDFRNKLN